MVILFFKLLVYISFKLTSTLENIINGNSKNPKILTIVKICSGLNIKMKDFFDSKCFENFEFEDLI